MIMPRPLTESQKTLLRRLRITPMHVEDLTLQERKIARSLHHRLLVTLLDKSIWEINNAGLKVDLDAPSEPRLSTVNGVCKSSKYSDGEPFKCPECGSLRLRVVETRDHRGTFKRRRRCVRGHKFWTVEVLSNGNGDIINPANPVEAPAAPVSEERVEAVAKRLCEVDSIWDWDSLPDEPDTAATFDKDGAKRYWRTLALTALETQP